MFKSLEQSFNKMNLNYGAGLKFSLLNPAARTWSRRYESSIVKFFKLKNQKNFLVRCLEEQVTPKTIDVRIKMEEEPFHPINRYVLNDRLAHCKEEIEMTAKDKRSCYNSLQQHVSSNILRRIVDFTHDVSRSKQDHHKNILNQKLNNLCKNSAWNKYSNTDSVINLSSKNLTNNEIIVLGLGLSFNLEPDKSDKLNTISSMEKLLYRYRENISEPQHVRGLIAPTLLSYDKGEQVLPCRLNNALKNLRSNHDIKILPADKGGKIVILDNNEYIDKAQSLLDDDNTYEKLNKNPLLSHNKYVRKEIENNLKHYHDPNWKKKFLKQNCSLPYFYGLPKLHKSGVPLRPVVSQVNTIARPISGWLAGQLSKYLGCFSNAHIKNSLDFKNRLNDFAQNNDTTFLKMISFDIKSLFTCIPTEEVLNFIERKIDTGNIVTQIPKENFMKLLEVCVKNNVFEFENQFFKQKRGLSMGSPLSPVLANLFMEFVESNLLPNIPNRPVLWLRYVDDVFALIENDTDHNALLNDLNSLSPTIQFTCELQKDKKLAFLDCLVTHRSSEFTFEVFRKPSNCGTYLHFFSSHPKHVKKSVLFSMLLRAYRICSVMFRGKEIDKIFYDFKKLGYPEYFIRNVHSEVRAKFFAVNTSVDDPPPERETRNHISLPFNEFTKSVVQPILKHHNVQVHYKSSNTIRGNLIKTKPKKRESNNGSAGVYVIPCSTQGCGRKYVGQTGRNVSQRIKEHKYALRIGNENNAPTRHVIQNNHTIDFSAAETVFKSKDLETRLTVESLLLSEIPNINNLPGAKFLDKASRSIVLKDLSKLKKLCPHR